MRKFLLSSVFAVFLLSLETGMSKAQTCTTTPECADLGYTKTKADCPKGALKCPYGDGMFCENINLSCAIGDIYYSDNTCSTNVVSGKTALGVVVYVTDKGAHGQAMSAWPVDANGSKSNTDVGMSWSTEFTDIPALPNYTSQSTASADFNSCSNTDKIVAQDFSSTYPAAWAARKYAPTTETKGKWCLPAAGVMTSIYNNQSAVKEGISKLGGIPYPSCYMWSSSEYGSFHSWYLCIKDSHGLSYTGSKAYTTVSVRPVIEF